MQIPYLIIGISTIEPDFHQKVAKESAISAFRKKTKQLCLPFRFAYYIE